MSLILFNNLCTLILGSLGMMLFLEVNNNSLFTAMITKPNEIEFLDETNYSHRQQ
jgi:hypothetical protein